MIPILAALSMGNNILRPMLWDLLLDPLLWELQSRGDYCQTFADDVVLVFDGDSAIDIERQANAALSCVKAWGHHNKLKFEPQKTVAIVVTCRTKYDVSRFDMGGVAIGIANEIKILGLTLDNKLTFCFHVTKVCTLGTSP